jgi:acyl-CoA thioesterase-1
MGWNMKKTSLIWLSLVVVLAALVAGCAASELSGPPAVTNRPASEAASTEAERKTILILGDSIAAGNGVRPGEAFPALIQAKIDALGWPLEVVNAGVSGDTTAGGLGRIDWLLRRQVDVLILELGGNDGLRGVSPAETKRNLQAIIDRTKSKYPPVKIVIAGMQMPPNLGNAFASEFRAIFPELAKTNGAALIPFLLEGVGGVAELNQPDRIHPTPAGHKIVAENVWKVLKPVLESER